MKKFNKVFRKKEKSKDNRNNVSLKIAKRWEYCDICDYKIEEPEGYLLTTKAIVTNEGYWKKVLPGLIEKVRYYKGKEFSPIYFQMIIADLASNDTPWIICEKCSSMFSIDLNQAREKACKWWLTGQPGSGFRLCELIHGGKAPIVNIIDGDGMKKAMIAVTKAYSTMN